MLVHLSAPHVVDGPVDEVVAVLDVGDGLADVRVRHGVGRVAGALDLLLGEADLVSFHFRRFLGLKHCQLVGFFLKCSWYLTHLLRDEGLLAGHDLLAVDLQHGGPRLHDVLLPLGRVRQHHRLEEAVVVQVHRERLRGVRTGHRLVLQAT